ncbi:unnamed protein product [Pieris macdunnoughi]|uniref:Uncharacterized protein n=1 Tax=Pieris macdunnoughi TaxID=345717 RepID=A0A821MAV5_9NEOP|nr:unnamed protein product [Pieris macdunnoughi]
MSSLTPFGTSKDSNTTVPEFSTERVGSDGGKKETEEIESRNGSGQEDEGRWVVLRGRGCRPPLRTPQCGN